MLNCEFSLTFVHVDSSELIFTKFLIRYTFDKCRNPN